MKWIAGAIVVCAMAGKVMAIDATTNEVLVSIVAALKPALEKLEPQPSVAFPEQSTSVLVAYRAQTYQIHARLKSGRVSSNTYERIGPSYNGFVLHAQLQPRGDVNQACTPQTCQGPYWKTDLDVTPIWGTDYQVYWGLSYMGWTPTNVLEEIRVIMRGLEKRTPRCE